MLVCVLTYSPAALPSTTRAAPAKKRTLSTVNSTSKSATPFGFPTFCCSRLDSVSASPSIASANLWSAVARSAGVVCDQVAKAARAAATARSTSATSPFGTWAISCSVAGLMTGAVSPLPASAQSPSMNIWRRVAVMVMARCRTFGGVWQWLRIGAPIRDDSIPSGDGFHDSLRASPSESARRAPVATAGRGGAVSKLPSNGRCRSYSRSARKPPSAARAMTKSRSARRLR